MKIINNTDSFLEYVQQLEGKTPYMLVDLIQLKRNSEQFKQLLPRVKLLYAVKAYYSEETVGAVNGIVDGFDAASISEIRNLLAWGVDVSSIELSNPVKSESSIKQARQIGLSTFTAQSKNELKKIQSISPAAHVMIRLKVNDTHSLVPLSDKFGCQKDEAIELLQYADSIGLKSRGVSFHVGSQLVHLSSWKKAIEEANQVIHEVRDLGIESNVVNIGGGFCARYFHNDPTLRQASEIINPSLDDSIDYYAEPGRYLVADTAIIATTVIGVEQRNGSRWVFLDVGRFQAFLGADRYEVFPYVPSVYSFEDGIRSSYETIQCTLTGPSCDSQDIIVEDIALASNIKVGDKLLFPNTGAYTLVYGSNFNGFSKPTVYSVQDGKFV